MAIMSPRPTSRLAPLALVLGLLAAAAACGGDDGNGPRTGGPASLHVVSGGGQQGPIALPLPAPIVLEVQDAAGGVVAGATVVFDAPLGSGVDPESTVTDAAGRVSTVWTMPQTPQSLLLHARVPDVDTVYIDATAVAGDVASIEVVRGDSQAALVGTALDTAVVIQLRDSLGNGVAGRYVVAAVAAGQGSVAPDSVLTDAAGQATFTWTMGPTKGYDSLRFTHATTERRIGAIALPPIVPDSVALGGPHTCFIATAGPTRCFGLNVWGEVGNGDTTAALTPTPVGADPGFRALAAGIRHTCGLTASNALYCWGDALVPLGLVPTLQSVGLTAVQLVAGHDFTCALTAAGAGSCWGRNDGGKLGDGSTTDQPLPVPIAGGLRWRQLDADLEGACGLTTGGRAYCWGYGQTTPRRVPGNLRFSTIAVSAPESCGLTVDGEVWCWSLLGLPAKVSGAVAFAQLSGGSAGFCGAAVSGTGYCWGLNGDGQVGDGTYTDRPTPVPVSSGAAFRAVYRGEVHSCGRTTAGGLLCWGGNASTILGTGATNRPAPVTVAGGLTFAALAAGDYFTCGRTAADAYCWGRNDYGQLGDGSTTDHPLPAPVSAGSTWTDLQVGVISACGIGSGGARCWGSGVTAPVTVAAGVPLVTLDAGYGHYCGRTAAGGGWCWGSNFYGQVGDSSTTDRAAPVPVAGGHTWSSLSAGQAHTCGVDTQGHGFCWGSAYALGTGNVDYFYPGPVSGGLIFTRIEASNSFYAGCGLTPTGEAWCWGMPNASTVPVKVPAGQAYTALTIGNSHACALTSQGQAECWGANTAGQLGDGTATDRTSPVAVLGNHTWSSLSAGREHTCGVTVEGETFCWGGNDFGELGIGSTTRVAVPVVVW